MTPEQVAEWILFALAEGIALCMVAMLAVVAGGARRSLERGDDAAVAGAVVIGAGLAVWAFLLPAMVLYGPSAVFDRL